MDTIGKIFAFIVLVCAVAFVSAAIVLTQQAEDWKKKFNDKSEEMKTVVKEKDAEIKNLKGTVTAAVAAQTKAETERDQYKADMDAAKLARDAKATDLKNAEDANTDLRNTNAAQSKTIENYRTQVADLEKEKTAAKGSETKALAAKRKAEEDLATAENDLSKTRDRLQQVTQELNAARAEVAVIKERLGPDYKPVVEEGPKVPPLIKGAVLMADNDSGLIMVSVGKDDGVKEGMTFEVVRPPQKYIGRIQVFKVDDEQAFCRIVPAMTKSAIEENDYVATRLQ